ncbi:MAG: efflux RND transporter periplasmic adaptor subunit [Anaerolineae bacterium]|nr:efflux RND transporter periplasmic adaptor subunit [Anaerolineae bacterium]
MKRLPIHKHFSGFVFILLLGFSLLITGCNSTADPLAQAAAEPTPEPITPVEVAETEIGDIALVFEYTGNLVSKDEVKIMPGAAGRVEIVLVEVGDSVKTGDPIATLERDVYITQLRQAQAGLTTAKLNLAKMEMGARPEEIALAEAALQLSRAALDDVATVNDDERTTAASALANAQAALRLAQAEYDKIAWAGNVGLMPQAMALEQATIAYETALSAYNLQTNPSDAQLAPLMAQEVQAELNLLRTKEPFREIDFEIARTAIEQAEAAVELANHQLDEATIKAPFDGVIAELYITEGSSVGPQAPVALEVSAAVEMPVGIEESRIGQVANGQPAALQVDAYPGQDFAAVVSNIAPVADKNSHTFKASITPLDENGLLRSGMFAVVSILIQQKQGTLLVPLDAITEVNGQSSVFVVKRNVAELRPVTVGLTSDGQVEILSGLEAGETVVIAGQSNLTDGAKVETVNRL